MLRYSYLASLVALQIALAVEAAPPLARMLRTFASAAAAHGGLASIVQLGTTGLAAIGLAVTLIFPAVALLRHRQRGNARFRGVPRWAVAVMLAGAALLVAAVAVKVARPLMPVDLRNVAALVARPALMAGIALMAAGALCAELLRRSVAPRPRPDVAPHASLPRIEVIHPPELSTRAA
ncbi:MAG: hypothetical protein ABI886_02440 [Betaproteobacteria bacterium]